MKKKHPKTARAEEVRGLLDDAGLNQCEAARLLGISERSMRRYVALEPEAGTMMPAPTFTLLRLLTDQRLSSRRRGPPLQ